MGFLDNISKSLTQGLDRAKFEAEKFQKTAKLQGEVSDLNKQLDARRLEFADRAIDLFKAGQIQSATLGEILKSIEELRTKLTMREEELKLAQTDAFPELPVAPVAQSVPVQSATPTAPVAPVSAIPASNIAPSAAAQEKTCPSCGFQSPQTAAFCPKCGARLAV